jgi:predicted nuclease of predicted toxin-antitoxin system
LRTKLDEDLPSAAAIVLAKAGHDVARVRDQGMGGWKDPPLWKAIQDEDRFLVTGDKGFGDIRLYPPGKHAGVLVLRPEQDGIGPLLNLLNTVLGKVRLDDLAKTVTVATPRGIRCRRPPEQ